MAEGLARNIPAFARFFDAVGYSHAEIINFSNIASKFYLFDVGLANAMAKRQIAEERGESFGPAFEHFIFMEIVAYSSYSGLHFPVHF